MQSDSRKRAPLPALAGSRLTSARLRRPTPLPTVVPTTLTGRWLLRLAWLFGGYRG
jgi:hypothetical protein